MKRKYLSVWLLAVQSPYMSTSDAMDTNPHPYMRTYDDTARSVLPDSHTIQGTRKTSAVAKKVVCMVVGREIMDELDTSLLDRKNATAAAFSSLPNLKEASILAKMCLALAWKTQLEEENNLQGEKNNGPSKTDYVQEARRYLTILLEEEEEEEKEKTPQTFAATQEVRRYLTTVLEDGEFPQTFAATFINFVKGPAACTFLESLGLHDIVSRLISPALRAYLAPYEADLTFGEIFFKQNSTTYKVAEISLQAMQARAVFAFLLQKDSLPCVARMAYKLHFARNNHLLGNIYAKGRYLAACNIKNAPKIPYITKKNKNAILQDTFQELEVFFAEQDDTSEHVHTWYSLFPVIPEVLITDSAIQDCFSGTQEICNRMRALYLIYFTTQSIRTVEEDGISWANWKEAIAHYTGGIQACPVQAPIYDSYFALIHPFFSLFCREFMKGEREFAGRNVVQSTLGYYCRLFDRRKALLKDAPSNVFIAQQAALLGTLVAYHLADTSLLLPSGMLEYLLNACTFNWNFDYTQISSLKILVHCACPGGKTAFVSSAPTDRRKAISLIHNYCTYLEKLPYNSSTIVTSDILAALEGAKEYRIIQLLQQRRYRLQTVLKNPNSTLIRNILVAIRLCEDQIGSMNGIFALHPGIKEPHDPFIALLKRDSMRLRRVMYGLLGFKEKAHRGGVRVGDTRGVRDQNLLALAEKKKALLDNNYSSSSFC